MHSTERIKALQSGKLSFIVAIENPPVSFALEISRQGNELIRRAVLNQPLSVAASAITGSKLCLFVDVLAHKLVEVKRDVQ